MKRITATTSAAAIDPREQRKGVALGLFAYLWWGMLMPFYLYAVRHVPIFEVLTHRILWSMALLAVIMIVTRRLGPLLPKLTDRRTLLLLAGSTLVIASNWLGFIYAIQKERLLEAGLGYYINPLVSVFLGFVILRERLRRFQVWAILLALVGVIVQTIGVGKFPIISIWVAFSFGFYGLFRKMTALNSIEGLAMETLLLGVPGAAYLAWLMASGKAVFLSGSVSTSILLALAGVITAVPLMCFASAARRLRLATIGFMQYITPTLQSLTAVVAFGEPLRPGHIATFLIIWAALALYSWDAMRALRQNALPAPSPVASSGHSS